MRAAFVLGTILVAACAAAAQPPKTHTTVIGRSQLERLSAACAKEPQIMVTIDLDTKIDDGRAKVVRSHCHHQETLEKCTCIVAWYNSPSYLPEPVIAETTRVRFQGML